jgi:uncharacterized BrkB/YihY/UPF0761 family membrane protein
VLPDTEIAWRDVLIGALVTAVLFTLGKFLIGEDLGRASLSSTFGAAGSFAVLLVWIYYSALISFCGAEFTQVFSRRYGSRIRPVNYAVRKGEKPDAIKCSLSTSDHRASGARQRCRPAPAHRRRSAPEHMPPDSL